MVKETDSLKLGTRAIHAGQDPNQWRSGAVVPPLSLATTFIQRAPAELAEGGFDYSRAGNPTRKCFEECVASVEGAKHALAFSSGLASSTTVLHLLNKGEEVVCMDDVYGGMNRLLNKVFVPNGVTVKMVDCTKSESLEEALTENTRIVWIETPTNPTMKCVDIEACAKLIKGKLKRKDAIFVVDNTFMSPYNQKPLQFGADVSMHSVSKYINGHSDVIMGVLMTNNDELASKLRFLQNALGAVPSPFDCFLANRGLKTLHLRMERHNSNALKVAHFLDEQPLVVKVAHPGLKSYPWLEVHAKQCTGNSGMVTFWLKGDVETSKTFIAALKVFTLAESLGGFESLVELPCVMTHASVPPAERALLGISDTLIRLSVGIEDADDLIDDLTNAFAAIDPTK